MAIHRINALIAYNNGAVSNYTAAYDGQVQKSSHTDVATTEAELYSWPAFRNFMEGIDSIVLGSVVDISHVKDIAWSVAMSDDTGKQHIGGFEAKGGSGTNSNTTYTSANFPTVADEIADKLGGAATATATMRPTGLVTTVARGSGYTIGDLTVVGGTFSTVALLTAVNFSTVAGQTQANYTGGEFTGTFTPGSGYNGGDTIALSDGTVITVNSAGATGGDVLTFTVTSASTSGHANWATLTQSNTSGGGVGFTLTQDDDNQGIFTAVLKQVGEIPIGEYTVIPADPVSTTGNGSGATFNLDWGVRNVVVADGGEGYDSAPAVSFSGGAGTTATAVLTADVVTSVTVGAAGSGYSAVAVVTIAAP
jgi:hypothetical protein